MFKSAGLILLFCFVSSFSFLAQSQKIEKLKDNLKEATSAEKKSNILSDIANAYYNEQIYYDSAFYYAEKARILAKENNLKPEESKALLRLGIINSFLDNHEKAIGYYEEALIVDPSQANLEKRASIINNIGASYYMLKDYKKAIEFYNKSLDIAVQANNDFSLCVAYMNIGEAQYSLGQLTKAKETLEKAISILELIDSETPTVYLFYARTLYALNDLEGAKEAALKSNAFAREEADIKYTAESFELLSKISSDSKDYEDALIYLKKYNELNDKLNVAKQTNEIEKFKINQALQESNETIADLSKKNQYLNIIYILAFVGFSILILLIFRQRKVVKMTKEIHDIQKRLIETEVKIREDKRTSATALDAAKKQDQEYL